MTQIIQPPLHLEREKEKRKFFFKILSGLFNYLPCSLRVSRKISQERQVLLSFLLNVNKTQKHKEKTDSSQVERQRAARCWSFDAGGEGDEAGGEAGPSRGAPGEEDSTQSSIVPEKLHAHPVQEDEEHGHREGQWHQHAVVGVIPHEIQNLAHMAAAKEKNPQNSIFHPIRGERGEGTLFPV